MNKETLTFWAKTDAEGNPGISVTEHCINAGCVAKALIETLAESVQALLPQGSVSLVSAHDIGKISAGFQLKCPKWIEQNGFTEASKTWSLAESDHSVVSQYRLAQYLRSIRFDPAWSIAIGAHHGKVHGNRVQYSPVSNFREIEESGCNLLIQKLLDIFGPFPNSKPDRYKSKLWLLAGLTTVADWISSNECFFSPSQWEGLEKAQERAQKALSDLHWSGGSVKKELSCSEIFGFETNLIQKKVLEVSSQPGLFIIEGPMGCGKTEAALLAAYQLIASDQNRGFYFGLPTQVTSNRIHLRVEDFLGKVLKDPGNYCLIHGASWLKKDQAQLLCSSDSTSQSEMRSWFASSKHALLARYGVGTIDQALYAVVAVKHFFVRRLGLAGKVVILDEVHSYDVYTGSLITKLVRELLALKCTVIILSATLTKARRCELLATAGMNADNLPVSIAQQDAYPLITAVQEGQPSSIPIEWHEEKRIKLRVAPLSEKEIIQECIRRAELGQNVLYIRNTVAEAQATYRVLKSAMREDAFDLGLLHSRFPYFRREELEDQWLERLGKHRQPSTKGSILVSTQVVEQSVDIDLDFMVSDLAPSDMLLQRMGRLWRHARPERRAGSPECWVNLPASLCELQKMESLEELKNTLGKSGKVYAPYVLLRSAAVFHAAVIQNPDYVSLPRQIREILEATYDSASENEPELWKELLADLNARKQALEAAARSVTLILARPLARDQNDFLTRYSQYPSMSVVLLKKVERSAGGEWSLLGVNGQKVHASSTQWRYSVAALLHKNSVKVPRFCIREIPEQPEWFSLHVQGEAVVLIVDENGECSFPDVEENSGCSYNKMLGFSYSPGIIAGAGEKNDDDEFD